MCGGRQGGREDGRRGGGGVKQDGAPKGKAQRCRLRTFGREPRTAVRQGGTMNVKVVGVVVKAIMRGSPAPKTLRKSSMDHRRSGPFQDVKVRPLDHGITLGNAGTRRLVQDAKVAQARMISPALSEYMTTILLVP